MNNHAMPVAITIVCALTVLVGIMTAYIQQEINQIHLDIEEVQAELFNIQLQELKHSAAGKEAVGDTGLTVAEYDLIAQVCHTEARGEGLDGMVAVAQVIRNRLNDGRFGKTIAEICTSKQFHGLNYIDGFPCSEAHEAVKLVFMHGYGVVPFNALYFCTNRTSPDAIKKGLKLVSRVGNHSFYTDL